MGAVKGDAMTAILQTKPYAFPPGHGRSLRSWGARVSIKAASEQTAGAFNLFEVCCPPGFATPLHIHYAEDVAVYVLNEDTLIDIPEVLKGLPRNQRQVRMPGVLGV